MPDLGAIAPTESRIRSMQGVGEAEVVPPINELLSTSITVKPCACPAIAAAQLPAPDPMQIQSTVEDHVLAGIRLPCPYSLP